MDNHERIKAVQRMQEYINDNINERIVMDQLCKAAGYSKWHSIRIFKDLTGKTPFEYIRELRLTQAARNIRDNSHVNIMEIALDTGYESHEGFLKAFSLFFGVNPKEYSNTKQPLNYFSPTPIIHYYLLLKSKENMNMRKETRVVTATIIEKPACKLVLLRGIKSTDYFSYCEEMGCDIWGVLESIPEAIDKVAFVELPPTMITGGTGRVACAVEVPTDFNSSVPIDCSIIDIPEHKAIWFQGAPYEEENWFGEAHSEMNQAVKNYKPELHGLTFASDTYPIFHYGTSAETGCREVVPVRNL